MKDGLLWYDDEDTLRERVIRAATRYAQKTGGIATVCYVNAGDNPDGIEHVAQVRIEARGTILRNHYWIGRFSEAR